MFLTPPDIISQVMLALPMWALFEFGIIMSRVLLDRDNAEEDEDDEDQATSSGNKPMTAPVDTSSGKDIDVAAYQPEPMDAGIDTGPPPKGYSGAAYPDDYEPLDDAALEAELDAAEAWEDAQDDDDREDDDDAAAENPAAELQPDSDPGDEPPQDKSKG